MKYLLLAILLLTGCAWLPEPGKKADMIAAPSMQRVMAAAHESLPVRGGWVRPDWWRSFISPALNDLIAAALRDSPNLKRVGARLQQAQTLVDSQAAELYPTIGATVSFSAQRFSANSVQAKLAGQHFRQLLINPFVLRYHLDLWGRDEAALQAAIGKAHAAETGLADARLLLAAAVAKAYFDLAILSAHDDIVGQILAYRSQLKAIAKTRLDHGLSSDQPLLNAEKALLKTKERQIALRAQMARQKNLLAVLVGKGPDWAQHITVDARLDAFRPEVPRDLPLHLLSRRPDVEAARLRVQAAAEEVKVARTAFYPDVNLIAFSGLHSVSISDVLLQGSSLAYAVGPSVDFPLFEGGRLRAQLGYQEAAFNEAVEIYNTAVLRAVQEVADAVERVQEVAARLREQQQLLDTLGNNRRIADALYREGLENRIDSLETGAEELEQQLSMAALRGESAKSMIQFYTALGGGYAASSQAR